MSIPRLRAGQSWSQGVLEAITLPDGAFKLYVWLRLKARLDTGSLAISRQDLARALGKARGTIRAHLRALQQAGVCRMTFPRDPRARGCIEITDDYWPYERSAAADPAEVRGYVDRIRELLAERVCVRKSLRPSDELVARQWYAQGIPVERVRRAILLGCGRKYVAWLDGAAPVVIGSLRYFEPILAEVEAASVPPEYWDYVRLRVQRMERLWLEAQALGFRTASHETAVKPPSEGIAENGAGLQP